LIEGDEGMSYEQKTMIDLAKEAFRRGQERVNAFVEVAKKCEVDRPENELSFIGYELQESDIASLQDYMKKEIEEADSEMWSSLIVDLFLDVIVSSAVDGFILDRFNLDVHSY
jgi:DNA polymerase III alpha subunit